MSKAKATTLGTDLERARARAEATGVRVTAWATAKNTGQRFAAVQGAHGSYAVAIGRSGALTCSCPARRLCTHIAVVHDALARREKARQLERDTAPLRRSNTGISIWK